VGAGGRSHARDRGRRREGLALGRLLVDVGQGVAQGALRLGLRRAGPVARHQARAVRHTQGRGAPGRIRAAMRAMLFICCLVGGGVGGAARAAGDKVPYRVWWSFPNDDETAIEVDEPDLAESTWEGDRWKFAVAMQKCNVKRSKVLAEHRDETPVRE